MKIIIEIEHLILREHNAGDAEKAYPLNLDPDVIKHTGDDAFASIDEARTFLINYEHYIKYGFGRWIVLDKQTHEFLGWCGLKYTPELDEFDVGYRFFKKHLNKGYATEAASACLKLGFEKFGMKTIVGRAMKKNVASIKLLEKLGLTYFEERDCGMHDGVMYKISA